MLVSLPLLVAAAWAAEPPDADELFPPAAITAARAAEILVPARIGPPARAYDQTTVTPGFARVEETAIEAAAFGPSAVPPSDAQRRYTRQLLSLLREGTAHNRVEWFLAEHMGLATVPGLLGSFYTSDLDPARVGRLVAGLVPRDPELRSVAVAVERDEAHGVWVGVVTGLFGAAAFEPFPRVHAPGGVAVIPGTLLAGDASYGLFVSYPGTEVKEFPLAGKGAFDVEVPLPADRGVYRVAMNKRKKRQLPDSAFFFTLYVGEEPPTAFPATATGQTVPAGAGLEQDFLAHVNHARAAHGLGPLAWVDRATDLRAALAGLPPHDRKVARWRYVQQVAMRDPVPGQPHGAWGPAFTDGQDAAEAAWTAIEHPITRDTFLGADYTFLTAGALTSADGRGVTVLSFAIEPGADPLASRDAAYAALAPRAPSAATAGASELGGRAMVQGKLDAVAAEVASGKRSLKQGLGDAGKELKDLQKNGWVAGGLSWSIYAVPPGEVPDLSGLQLPTDTKHFVIGAANGDLGTGRGIDYTVLVIVAASSIK